MQYIIFMLTIQLPFLYLIWKFFKPHFNKANQAIHTANVQNYKIADAIDLLRLSFEKSTEDIYSRLKKLESKQELIESRIYSLEKYTGLRSNTSNPELQKNSLINKDFI